MIKSKLTSRMRTTIPQSIRAVLHLREGDEIVYEIAGDRVSLAKGPSEPRKDPYRAFCEWNSEADRRAYANL